MGAGLRSLTRGGHGGILAGGMGRKEHTESSSGHSVRMPQGTMALPPPLVIPSPPHTLTLLEAAQGDGALADEVVLRGGVIILHHKAHERKLRHRHLKLKLRVPPWVEP